MPISETFLYLCTVKNNSKIRNVLFYKTYFQSFFSNQNKKVKAKIIWTLQLIEELPRVPELYLKHIQSTQGLYEIRVKFGSDIFRIFCMFDDGHLVVLFNGFKKDTSKTPQSEIKLALKIKAEYEYEKINKSGRV